MNKENLTCINCGASMIKRQGPFGEFMGCTNFPRCKSKQKMPRNQEVINKSVMAFAEYPQQTSAGIPATAR